MSNKFVNFSNSRYVGQDYYLNAALQDPYPYYYLQRIEKGSLSAISTCGVTE